MKSVVFSFGRMNPPTVGHEKLVDKIQAVAKKIMRGDAEGKSFIQRMVTEIITDLKKNNKKELGFDSEDEDEDDNDDLQPR